MRAAAAWLGGRPQLGREVFGRGDAESLKVEDRTGISAELPALLQAYAAARRRALARRPYAPKHRKLWTVQEALARLGRLVGALPDWAMLQRFLPDGLTDPVEQRAALASTLIAALETARGGGIELRQEQSLRPHPDPPPRRGRGIARCKSCLSRAALPAPEPSEPDPALFAHALRLAEALVFASDRPIAPQRLQQALPPGVDARAVLTALAGAMRRPPGATGARSPAASPSALPRNWRRR